MGGGGEAGAVADGDQHGGGGPGRDPWNRGQDLGKRVLLRQGLDPGLQGPALFMDGGERVSGPGTGSRCRGCRCPGARWSVRRARRRRRRSAAGPCAGRWVGSAQRACDGRPFAADRAGRLRPGPRGNHRRRPRWPLRRSVAEVTRTSNRIRGLVTHDRCRICASRPASRSVLSRHTTSPVKSRTQKKASCCRKDSQVYRGCRREGTVTGSFHWKVLCGAVVSVL